MYILAWTCHWGPCFTITGNVEVCEFGASDATSDFKAFNGTTSAGNWGNTTGTAVYRLFAGKLHNVILCQH